MGCIGGATAAARGLPSIISSRAPDTDDECYVVLRQRAWPAPREGPESGLEDAGPGPLGDLQAEVGVSQGGIGF